MRLTNKQIIKELKQNVEATITTTENVSKDIYLKFAEFEDFMESFGCEELEEIEHLIGYPRFVDGYDEQENEINRIEFITYKESFNEVFDKNKKLNQENQALKTRWQKLKEWVKRKYADDYIDANDTKSPLTAQEYYGGSADSCRKTLDKMQELEKE